MLAECQFPQELAKELDVSCTEFNQDNQSVMIFSDDIEILFEKKEDQMHFFANILMIDESCEGIILEHVMKGNLLRRGTGKNILGLSDDGKYLTLRNLVSYEESYEDFKNSIEDFINYLLFWKKEIEEITKRAKASTL
ncbi:MAG TPA: type III secretion system chaperone [Chlamydiales bacterium]|nr:type III secretion system chaperone [Chlamydiales bacterium]